MKKSEIKDFRRAEYYLKFFDCDIFQGFISGLIFFNFFYFYFNLKKFFAFTNNRNKFSPNLFRQSK